MSEYTSPMSTILRSLGLLLAAILASHAASGIGSYSSSLERFLAAPSVSTWTAFEHDIESGKGDAQQSPFPALIGYHRSREQRDLPNSMARIGISPDEYVKQQEAKVERSFELIRQRQSEDLWRLLRILILQNFDDGLVDTASEIAARLSPERFTELAAEVDRAQPAKSWIMDRAKGRWNATRKNSDAE
jgi:hypothetical protein